ncbi:MAG: ComEA family DNA-binding protein [Acidiferrobacterales bacterium]
MRILRALLLSLSLCLFSALACAEVININTADAETLVTLQGVGEKRAAAIVEYRAKYGPFESVDELVKVKGIGPKTVEKNRDNMTVE